MKNIHRNTVHFPSQEQVLKKEREKKKRKENKNKKISPQ